MRDNAADRPARSIDLIVFYDGICPFCHAAVRWLLKRDRLQLLHFAALQGDTARTLRARWPDALSTSDTSMILLDLRLDPPRCHRRSEAVFLILRELGWPWQGLCLLERMPRALWDCVYDAFAARRYRLFGRYAECHLPNAKQRARLLS